MSEYVKLNHPVLGEIEVRKDLAESTDAVTLNRMLVEEAAKYAEDNEIDVNPFARQFEREFTSSIRGGVEAVTGDRTTTIENDFLAEVALSKDPVWGYGGLIAGAIADPVTLPAAFLKLFKLGRVTDAAVSGAVAGGASGLIQPVREEFGESRTMNTAFGAGGGALIGGALQKVLQHFNAKNAEELQRMYDEADSAGKKDIEDQVTFLLESPRAMDQRHAAEAAQATEAKVIEDAAARAERMTQEAQLQQIREAGDAAGRQLEIEAKAKAATQRISDEAAMRNESNRLAAQEAKLNQDMADAQSKINEQRSTEYNNQVAEITQRVRADRINELKATMKGIIAPRKGETYDAEIKKAANQVRAWQKQINEIEAGTRKAGTKGRGINALMAERDKALADLETVKALKSRANERDAAVKEYVQLVKYNRSPVAEQRIAEEVGKIEKPKMLDPVQVQLPARPMDAPVVREPVQADPATFRAIPEGMAQAKPLQQDMLAPINPDRVAPPNVGRSGQYAQGSVQRTGTPSEQPPSATPQAPTNAAPTASTATPDSGVDKLLGNISTRIKNISEEVFGRLRRYEFNVEAKVAKAIQESEAFMRMDQRLPKAMRDDIALKLFNGDHAAAMKAMSPEMRREFAKVQKLLRQTYADLKAVGLDFPEIKNYFPRRVKDYDGLLNALGREKAGVFDEALNVYARKNGMRVADIEADMRSEIMDQVVRGVFRKGDTAIMPNAKQRSISKIDPKYLHFYEDPSTALSYYVRNANQTIEKAKFFGRTTNKTSTGTVDVDKSIGNYLEGMSQQNGWSHAQQQDMLNMLRARFIEGERAPSGFISGVRDFGYMGTIGNTISAITQLGDLGTSGALHGLRNTIGAMLGTKNYRAIDLGIDHSIAHELQNERLTSKALNKVFSISGFRAIDRLGKETLMNAAMRKNEKLVKSAEGEAKFREKWSKVFGSEIDSVVTDLKVGNITDNTKFLAFNEVADVQPIALSEMPEMYLKSPNGRIFYMLKSFTLKQIDLVRRNVVQEFNKGNKTQAVKNAALLGGYLMAANTSTQVAKDLLLQREVKPEDIPDRAVWSLLSVFGINQYITDRYLAQGDVMGAVQGIVTPATPALDLAQAVYKQGKKAVEGEEVNVFATTKSLPIVGPILYSWFGGGKENFNDRADAKRFEDGY